MEAVSERAMITYNLLQKRKIKAAKKKEYDAVSFKVNSVIKSNKRRHDRR
jgi:hypothetical protein